MKKSGQEMPRWQDGVAPWQGFPACTLPWEHIVRGQCFHLLQWRGAQTMGSACPALLPKSSNCQPRALEHQNKTKPWREKQKTLFTFGVKKKNHLVNKREEGREMCPFDTDFAVNGYRRKTKDMGIPLFFFFFWQLRSLFWMMCPPIHTHQSGHLKQGFPQFSFMINFGVFSNAKWEMTFPILSCYEWPFPQQNVPGDTAHGWENESLVGLGPRVCRSEAPQTAGGTEEEGKAILLGGSSHRAPRRDGTHRVPHGQETKQTSKQNRTAWLHRTLGKQQKGDGRRLGLPHEIKLSCRAPAELQSPEVRKWRCLT